MYHLTLCHALLTRQYRQLFEMVGYKARPAAPRKRAMSITALNARLNKIALDSFARNRFFLLKEIAAVFIAALILVLAMATLWLAYTRSVFLAVIFFAILSGGLLAPYLAAMPVLHPRRIRVAFTPADFGIAKWQNVAFFSSDGVELRAWFIPPDPQSNGAAVVFVHGLGGNRGELLPEAAMLVKHGYGALLLDLRNHGRSRGTLTTLGYCEVEDVGGAVAYLQARPEVNPDRVGLFGYSMGGATVLRAAARLCQVRAVIAQSAYSSLEENIARGTIAQAGLPPFLFAPLIIWLGERATGLRVNQVRPVDDVAQIAPRAVMFIHGAQDRAITPDNSRRLYRAANEPKELLLIEHAEHHQVMQTNLPEYEQRVTKFLDQYLRS